MHLYDLVAIILLPLLYLAECNAYATMGTPHYIQTGRCKVNKPCVYDYETVVIHRVGTQAQNVTVSVTFEVACHSTGEYAYEKATKFCLTVTEGSLEHKGSYGTDTVAGLEQRLSGWFCFVQINNGKIPIVLHPQNATQHVVNFKKALVSGFQANFEGTKEEDETDPESVHMSYYRYIVQPDIGQPSGHMFRHFSQRDIDRTATGYMEGVGYTKDEEIEYRDGVLFHASGETRYVIPYQQHRRTHVQGEVGKQEHLLNDGRLYSPRRRSRRRVLWREQIPYYHPTAQSFYPSVTLDQFSVRSTYHLDLVHCSSASETVSRRRRNVQGSGRFISTSLKAHTDNENIVHNKINVSSILQYIHQHPDDTGKVQMLKLHLSTYSNSNTASEVVRYFDHIRASTEPDDVTMRLKMYAILASMTNIGTQQVLLSCIEDVTENSEWNDLLLNIALLVTPSNEFVAQLQSLIDLNTGRDPNSLLLVYGALASRAGPDLQSEMVAYLNSHLQQLTGRNDDLIAVINALGNSGSEQTIDLLLDLIDHNTIEIQVAIISALRKQTNSDRVLAAFLESLSKPSPDVRVVGAVVNCLIKGVEESGVANVQMTLAVAKSLMSASKALKNDYIDELVSYYFHQLLRYGVKIDTRLRRSAGNWLSSGPEYNMIASYEERQEDGLRYKTHSAYLWSNQIGVRNFNMQVAAGMFTGTSTGGGSHKVLGKAVAKVNIFGQPVTNIEVEVLRTLSSHSGMHKVVYVTVGGYVLLNFEAYTDDENAPVTYGRNIEYPVFKINWKSFVSTATMTTQLVVYAQVECSFGVDANSANKPNAFSTKGLLSPTWTVRMEGSSTLDVLGSEGEINLNGAFGYGFEAEGSVSECTYGQPAPAVDTTIKDHWPRGYINQSSWFKAQQMTPCGFEQCIWEGVKVQDNEPIDHWLLNAKHSERVWSESLYQGPDDNQVCPSNPKTPQTQASHDHDYPNWPDLPSRDMPNDPDYHTSTDDYRPLENSHP